MSSQMRQRGTAWVTGAGGGMGRASAIRLAASGFKVALSGRRLENLTQTRKIIEQAGGIATEVQLDVTDTAAVTAAAERIRAELGSVDVLVASAGLNTPRRYWKDQTMAEFSDIVSTNLTGVVATIDAVLPDMRDAKQGTVVLISSISGWQFSPDSGVAYSASKTALSSLTKMLNAQENQHGIRATHLCPGDVDSDFLQLRPHVPDKDAREKMLTPDDVAQSVEFVVNNAAHICINELVISPLA